MEIGFLFGGLIIGISIVAPVGPVGALCIRRTLTEGHISGLGAETSDAIYGRIAGFSLPFISIFLVGQQLWLSLIGAYASTFFLTLTNSMTILPFVAIFAGLGSAGTIGNYITAGILVLGVFIGSAL
jgi:hypothetical protein